MKQSSNSPRLTYDMEAAREAKARLLENHYDILEPLGAIGIGGTRETEESAENRGMAIRIRQELDEAELASRSEAISAALSEEGFPDMPVDVTCIGEIRKI